MSHAPRSYWMIESPTPDNPMKKKYIITVDSQTIEVYSESIAEALDLSGIPANSAIQFKEWLIGRGSCGSISENDHRLNT